MRLRKYPILPGQGSALNFISTMGWLAFMFSSSTSVASEAPEKTIERLTGYAHVKITKVSPHKIHIRHDQGGKTLRFDELPESLRKHYGMTEDEAKAAEKLERTRHKKNARTRAKNHFLRNESSLISGTIIKVLDDGVLIADAVLHTNNEEPIIVEKLVRIDGPSTLNPNRPVRYRRVLSHETVPLDLIMPNLIFIETPSDEFFDGAEIEASVWNYGSRKVSFDDQETTVLAFTTNSEDAWHELSTR